MKSEVCQHIVDDWLGGYIEKELIFFEWWLLVRSNVAFMFLFSCFVFVYANKYNNNANLTKYNIVGRTKISQIHQTYLSIYLLYIIKKIEYSIIKLLIDKSQIIM